MIEGKLGNSVKYGVNPGGFGATFDFPIVSEKLRLGAETGIMILSNWSDTLDLRNSPNPDDTSTYDIWIKNGTDLDYFIGPSFRYKFKLGQYTSFSPIISAGLIVNISAYDETKKATNPPPIYSKSEAPAELGLYLKPKLAFQYKKVYIGYEFFALSDELEHIVLIGITF